MLKHNSDLKTVLYLLMVTGILFYQWHFGFNIAVYIFALYLAVSVAVIAHNHNHVPIWKSDFLNHVTDYWITLFYGFPAFAWTPTHNKNHHKFNNREGDYTITYRYSERNNIFTLMSYPSVSAYFQHHPISHHLQHLWKNKRKEFFIAVFQYVALFTMIIIALVIDWRKTILYIIIPQQFALVTVLVFNYIQHVHADEESKFNHSRNFVSGFTNFMLFNNGFHTVHHYRASIHWSKLPEEHKKINHLIEPHLNEQVILVYLFKTYIMAPFHKSFRASSMRVARKKKELITAR